MKRKLESLFWNIQVNRDLRSLERHFKISVKTPFASTRASLTKLWQQISTLEKKFLLSPCPLQPRGRSLSMASSPIARPPGQRISAEKPQPTAVHQTITTARSKDYNRSSVLVRSRSTQFMARPSCEPRRRLPETRLCFCHFRVFFRCVR